jgi:ankyrin repeat protein
MGANRSKEILVLELVQYSDYLSLREICSIFNLSKNMPLNLLYFKNKNYIFDFLELKENIIIRLFQNIIKNYPSINPNILNNDKKTSLFIATKKNYSKYIKLLLTFPEIDVNLSEEKQGFTPLWIACRYNNIDSLEILLNHSKININKVTNYDITPLHISCSFGNTECVKLLINIKGIDINKADKQGITAFEAACWCGHIECAKLLINIKGIDINKADKQGITAFGAACRCGHTECVKLLLTHPDIDINIKDNNNMTPLMGAIQNNHKEIIQILSKIK